MTAKPLIPRQKAMDHVPVTWQNDAACVGETELFFGPDEESQGASRRRVETATAFCRTWCGVRHECLAYAIETRQKWGVWGGRDFARRSKPRKPSETDVRLWEASRDLIEAGMSLVEAAEQLGVKPVSVKMARSRVRSQPVEAS